ncbi:MAG: hypothetical protein IH986_11225 [Planctomycetes bacterium]|nr:hypothetical protein [Planctomycetota bacterium]
MSRTTFDDVPLTGWLRSVGEAFGQLFRRHPSLCKRLVRAGIAEIQAGTAPTELVPETEMSPARASVLLATIWLGGKEALAPLFDDGCDDVEIEEALVWLSFRALRSRLSELVDEQEPRLRDELERVERELDRRAVAPDRHDGDVAPAAADPDDDGETPAGAPRWEPPQGYISVSAVMTEPRYIKRGEHPKRTTIEKWELSDREGAAMVHAPDTNENYYPAAWIEERVRKWNPRTKRNTSA